jgi:hypothetical protein
LSISETENARSEAQHARKLAVMLRDAAAEGQSPWDDEGTCLMFTAIANRLDALADAVEETAT